MYCAKLTIPKMSDNYKLYIYRAKNAESINTIAKVRTLKPILIIDEAVCKSKKISCNGKSLECYEVYDNPDKTQAGVQYIGPKPNIVPVTFYETSVGIVKINDYTYVNTLNLNDIDNIHDNGTMMYYSVIGIDETNNIITHLSKVNGVMIKSEYKKDGARHLYKCEDFTGTDKDKWEYVSSVSWDEILTIGNINDKSALAKFGIPVVEKVKIFDSDKLHASIKPVPVNNFMVLEIPNPWQRNNKEYNFRKLKSYKLRNVEDEQYGDFSEPTFQSLLPVSIEKMLILRKTDSEHPKQVIEISESVNDDVETYQVIRKNGIYYNAKDHRKLGLNKYNIPLEEKTAVFNEASVQEKIKIQVEALPAHVYSYTIYLFDVYGNVSEPAHFVVTT